LALLIAIPAGIAVAQDDDDSEPLPTVPAEALDEADEEAYEKRADDLDSPPSSDGEVNRIPQVPPSSPLVADCQDELRDNPGDQECKVVIGAARGDVPPGDYSDRELEQELAD